MDHRQFNDYNLNTLLQYSTRMEISGTQHRKALSNSKSDRLKSLQTPHVTNLISRTEVNCYRTKSFKLTEWVVAAAHVQHADPKGDSSMAEPIAGETMRHYARDCVQCTHCNKHIPKYMH